MKCKNCNAELLDDAMFCGSCGTKVEVEAPLDETVVVGDGVGEDAGEDTVVMSEAKVDEPTAEETEDLDKYLPNYSEPVVAEKDIKKKKKKSKKGLAAGIVAVIILLLIAVFVVGAVLIGIGAYVLISNNFFGVFDGAKNNIKVDQSVTDVLNGDYDDLYAVTTIDPEYTEPAVTTAEPPAVTEPVEETTTTTPAPVTTAPEEETPDDNRMSFEVDYPYAIDQRIVIADGGLRIRSEAVLDDANILGLIPNGTIITIYSIEDNWAYASVGGKYGWCSCDYLFIPYEYTGSAMYTATIYCPTFEGAELYSEGYSDTDLLRTTVLNGSGVTVYAVNGDMAFVKYSNLYGWCSTDYLVRN